VSVLLVTGAGGMLGRAVVTAGREAGHETIGLARAELDITDPSAVAMAVAIHAPDAVINCAAWTDVDGAESDEHAATQVNGEAPGHVARAASAAGARIVHISTDYVFDGAADRPWLESDPVSPINDYGRSKLAGERSVTAAGAEHAIVRAAWLFGAGGRNFVDTMLTLARDRDVVDVVTDQCGHPTWTGHLAGPLVRLALDEKQTGLFHATGDGACSWRELADAVFRAAGSWCRAEPTTSDRFPRPARRPAYSVLGTERAPGVRIPHWRDGVIEYLRQRSAVSA
jgi:dTDP-4-dehydrorhamnose reductase